MTETYIIAALLAFPAGILSVHAYRAIRRWRTRRRLLRLVKDWRTR